MNENAIRASPRRNRVDPWGDLHSETGRGLFTGNRGCVVDGNENVVRHHGSQLWIICQTQFRGWRVGLARPRRWTPLFFLDDAVALAAGHRPCATCRRADYHEYRDAVTAGIAHPTPLLATELNKRLHTERHAKGRGLIRAHDRVTWLAPYDDLPDGTVVIDNNRETRLLLDDRTMQFTFDGWAKPANRPSGIAHVLTPPTSTVALRNGFKPTLHPSATSDRRF